jgi:hypothetical protein
MVVAILLAAWKVGRVYDRVLDLRYGARLPVPDVTAPHDAAEARRQDLDVLAGLTGVDRSFSPAARVEFATAVAGLRAAAAELDDARFFLGVAAAVAVAGNAHTSVDAVSWRAKLSSAPVRLAWFPEGLFVVRAMTGHEDLLGARVRTIDGLDPEALEREAARFFPGPEENVRALGPALLESPAALHALHPEASAGELVLEVQEAVGTRRVALAAVRAGQGPAATKPGRVLSPERLDDEAPGAWHALLDAARAPASLRDPGHSIYATSLGDGHTLYLHAWRIRDEPGTPIGSRMRRALGDAGTPPWQRIVLDLRFDAGGDYLAVYEALRELPGRLADRGELEILVDETTFSAAIISAVLARHFAGPRARVVGSRVGDRLAFWAEGTPAVLPHSGIRIGVSTGFHDWAHGCRALRCWWPNLYYSVADGDLEPDSAVRWRFSDYARGVDTVLERALQ